MASDRSTPAGITAVLASNLLFAWGFVLAKMIPMPPATLAFWRAAIGAVVLGGVAAAFRLPWPRLSATVVLAGVAFGGHQLLYLAAVKQTSIAIVVLLGAMLPLMVALVSHHAIGERVSRWLVAWTGVALAGVAVVVWANVGDPSRSLAGDLLAVANMVVFAAYFIAAKAARGSGARTVPFTALVLAITTVVVLPVALSSTPMLPPTMSAFWLAALLALGPGNGHLLLNWAHPRVRAALTSLLLMATPILAPVWAHLVLDEPLGVRHWTGIALVAVGIEGGRRSDARMRRTEPIVSEEI